MDKAVSVRCPVLLISALGSGQGKTTVTAALARLLTRRGHRVRVFKCGPDFLDPLWHQLASDAPVDNLDLWMVGEDDVRERLRAAARDCDVILVEGVMGLHDGTPSTADLARRFGLPVLAVVQAGHMAQTLGAVVHGLRHYRQEAGALRWAGVLANGVASDGHAALLQAAVQATVQETTQETAQDTAQETTQAVSDWLGHLPRSDALGLPERHLGLVAVGDLGLPTALARLDAAADALQATPLGQMTLDDWRARWSVDFAAPDDLLLYLLENQGQPLAGHTVAVARDAAFAFIYPANIEYLQNLGARVVYFSPLAGDALPACDALWLPGGYPELHAHVLAARTDLRHQLHAHAQADRPIWAECGGMMALFEQIETADGKTYPMWGLLPGRTRMQRRLGGLGMQQWQPSSHVCALRGHTFHYSVVDTPLTPVAYTEPAPGSARTQGEPIYAAGPTGQVRASYFHAWLPSSVLITLELFKTKSQAKNTSDTSGA
ncbi:cobyrinate a,c-diamide synthase [Ottowia sp.]|uniref:cobyrinate a,c-diamide synthase n=1 Tax=Ottowia sp. TaxID=1898956 RepID=UPI003A892587